MKQKQKHLILPHWTAPIRHCPNWERLKLSNPFHCLQKSKNPWADSLHSRPFPAHLTGVTPGQLRRIVCRTETTVNEGFCMLMSLGAKRNWPKCWGDKCTWHSAGYWLLCVHHCWHGYRSDSEFIIPYLVTQQGTCLCQHFFVVHGIVDEHFGQPNGAVRDDNLPKATK